MNLLLGIISCLNYIFLILFFVFLWWYGLDCDFWHVRKLGREGEGGAVSRQGQGFSFRFVFIPTAAFIS